MNEFRWRPGSPARAGLERRMQPVSKRWRNEFVRFESLALRGSPFADVRFPSGIGLRHGRAPHWARQKTIERAPLMGARGRRRSPGAQPDPNYRTLCEMLRKSREDNNGTQCDLAERLSKQRSYVWRTETTERRLDAVEFVRWCRACDSDPVAVFRSLVASVKQALASAAAYPLTRGTYTPPSPDRKTSRGSAPPTPPASPPSPRAPRPGAST